MDEDAEFVTIERAISSDVSISLTEYTGSDSTGVSSTRALTSDGETVNAKCSASGTAEITASYGSCVYVVVVPCRTSDMCSLQRRRMHEEAFKHDTIHDSDDEDVPYCLSDDYPCEGEEDNMVFVCHYSARQGYQTFCVPEADSDILRFYPHDYCGNCKYGGN